MIAVEKPLAQVVWSRVKSTPFFCLDKRLYYNYNARMFITLLLIIVSVLWLWSLDKQAVSLSNDHNLKCVNLVSKESGETKATRIKTVTTILIKEVNEICPTIINIREVKEYFTGET